jgi:hypothetical protein
MPNSSSNKYDYNKRNDYNKDDDKKKYRFGDKKKKKFQKMMSRACVALSNLDFSSDDSSSSEEDKKVKRKPGDFTGLCLMGKSSRQISDSNSNVSDDLSPESLSLRVIELENALCNQDKLLCKVFHENKRLNLELESVFSKISSIRWLRGGALIMPETHIVMSFLIFRLTLSRTLPHISHAFPKFAHGPNHRSYSFG